jgi:hypothetical protein
VENLFLRTQLALYQARKVKPQRATDPTRFTLVWLAQWFDWQPALVVVQPETFSDGGAKGATCSGVSRQALDVHQSRWSCKGSSSRWGVTT